MSFHAAALFKSQLQPSDKRLTDLCGCINALSAPRPLRFTDLEECTSQLPLSSQLVVKCSLSERHPQSGAVAFPFASVSSRCGCLCVFAGAHVTFDSSIFFIIIVLCAGKNRTGRCSSPLSCVFNQLSRSIRNIRISRSEGNLEDVKVRFFCDE